MTVRFPEIPCLANRPRASRRRRLPAPACTLGLACVLMLGLGACAPTSGDDGTFDVRKTTNEDFDVSYIDVGLYPVVIGAADIDADGDVDLAVSNRFDDSVTILTEGLDASETLPVGVGPTDVVFGNLDNSNGLDLVVLDQQNTRLSIYLAQSGGGWASPTRVEFEETAVQVSLIDLNGDGSATSDLIVSVSGAAQMWAFVNDGAGSFTIVATDTNDAPTKFLIGDYDGDAIPDLAVLNPTDDLVTIHLGNGDGTFSTPEPDGIDVKNYPVSIAEADFDGDGIADLAVLSRSEARVSILIGRGNGTFEVILHERVGGNPDQLVSGAFDSAPSGPVNDLAMIHRNKKRATLLHWDGVDDFEHAGRKLSEDPFTLATGDFNADGCTDLITSESIERTASVSVGDCAGNFERTVIGFSGEVSFPVVTDLDGNGTDDVVFTQKQSRRIVVLRNVH